MATVYLSPHSPVMAYAQNIGMDPGAPYSGVCGNIRIVCTVYATLFLKP